MKVLAMIRCRTGLLILIVAVGSLHNVGCQNRPVSSSDSATGSSAADGAAESATAAKSSGAAIPAAALTAQTVLDKMAQAYRAAATYEDFATAELQEPGAAEPRRVDFSVTFERPNKLRARLYQGEVVCDGKKWYGFSKDIPGQAVLRDAPKEIKLPMLQADLVLDQVLNKGFAGGSPQLLLLLEEKPLAMLLEGVRDQDLSLDEPGRIGDYDCYRVRYSRADGAGEYWIDQKTFVLRRVQFNLSSSPGPDGKTAPDNATMVINFERANLGGLIDDPLAFQYAVPDGTQCHRILVDPGPYDLIGKKVPDFQILDMQGKPWSSQALKGKTVALHLWRNNAEACLPVVPALQRAYEQFKGNDNVAIWAINLEGTQTDAKTIEETAKQWKLTVPILRDPELEMPKMLRLSALPGTFFLDAKGVLQDCIVGDNALAAAATAHKLEDLLAGKELAVQALEKFQQRVKDTEREVDLLFAGEAQTTTLEQAKATPPAAKTQPTKFRLSPLWKCNAIGMPGNILVTNPESSKPRIYVVDGYKAITEIALDGKPVKTQAAKLAAEEIFTVLRTAVSGDGKRHFAAFAPWQQRFHLFDEELKHVLSYPDNALENRNSGLTDVEFGSLEGGGKLNVYISFGSTVGVKCVSLDGGPIWSCRSLFNVSRILPGPADPQGHRDLYCISEGSSLAVLDATGQLRDATRIPGEGDIQSLVHADLTGGQETWCGIMQVHDKRQLAAGSFTALGLTSKGEVAWKYELPFGVQQPVDSIVIGRVLPGPARQWLLPGSDGSVHVLAADGALIDRFNYGEQVSGLAVVEIERKPALLISSASGVEALRVE
jgi:peroxiredoxin